MARERVIAATSEGPEEEHFNYSLRPQNFGEYIGQESLLRRLKIAVEAARSRREPVEHILLHGPPGLGKTTLACVIANELKVHAHVTSGPALSKAIDLQSLLMKLETGDVLFIDEIHRLPAVVEETLYSAMEDFRLEQIMDKGPYARAVTQHLRPFTLIGATTRIGLLTAPMRSRFGISSHLDFYPPEALHEIVRHNAKLLKVSARDDALLELARRSRGTPRIANRLLRRVRDFATVNGDGKLTLAVTREALELEGVDGRGLDDQDRRFLRTLIETYDGGPAGIEALAATMGEEIDSLVDVIEPYLLQTAMVTRTRQGRRASKGAYEHLGLKYRPPASADAVDESDSETLFEA